MANFRVGQKVVCIREQMGGHPDFVIQPIKGQAYTIRAMRPARARDYQGCALLLVEITNSLSPFDLMEYDFISTRFRPLISQADDVEMFRRISEDSLGRLEILEDALNEQFICDETHE